MKNCMLLAKQIYKEVDANTDTSTHFVIRAKGGSNKLVNVATYSKDKGRVIFLKKAAKQDFLVNEMIRELRCNGY